MIREIIRLKYLVLKSKMLWKKNNKSNKTKIGKICNKEEFLLVKNRRIKVGKNTYGTINFHASGNSKEELIIGSNCSISSHAHFLLGGEHEYCNLTMYPYKEMILNIGEESQSKGAIIVEDEVWIGCEALILSGVRIGKGAVVGAGAIVVHDVPAYAIVAGNPAKIIKYRFEENIIKKLIDFDLNQVKITKQNVDLLYKKITLDNVDEILAELKGIENYEEKY